MQHILNSNTNPKKVLLALKKAIEDTFTVNDWEELGLRTSCDRIIWNDPRLLHSLFWGDPDYGERVLIVIKQILEANPNNVKIIEEFVSLEKWLKNNNSKLYKELYGIDSLTIDDTEKIELIRNNVVLNQHMLRIRRSIDSNDLSQTIGSSKELLESVLKTILKDFGKDDTSHNIYTLLEKVQQLLQIDVDKNQKLNEKIKKTLNNLAQIIIGVAEIRNLVGTGHGRAESKDIDANHALLIVNSVYTLSMYLLNLWQEQKKQNPKK